MFREIRAPLLVRTSSLYFHKARALRHTSALLRYKARSLRHRYERAQFTIHFIKEMKKIVPGALLSYISTWEFLRILVKCKKDSALLSCSKKFPRSYITQQWTRRVFYFFSIADWQWVYKTLDQAFTIWERARRIAFVILEMTITSQYASPTGRIYY